MKESVKTCVYVRLAGVVASVCPCLGALRERAGAVYEGSRQQPSQHFVCFECAFTECASHFVLSRVASRCLILVSEKSPDVFASGSSVKEFSNELNGICVLCRYITTARQVLVD